LTQPLWADEFPARDTSSTVMSDQNRSSRSIDVIRRRSRTRRVFDRGRQQRPPFAPAKPSLFEFPPC